MNYGNIKYCDIADGVGVRTTLFVSGCTHHCPGCFQPETWDFNYGEPFTQEVQDRIIESLEPDFITGITVLGGEPMEPDNQRALLPFLSRVRQTYPEKSIWVFTGDVFESLVDQASTRRTEATDALLGCIDVLVDGPFIESLKDISARFRGSSNQRLIDVPASLEAGEVVEWQDPDQEFANRGEW